VHTDPDVRDFDFLIIGGGIAGLRAALTLAASGRVLVLTKADTAESNTGYAQGGIAAAIGPDDSPELHLADTLRAGDGLCDEATVGILVNEGPRYVHQLLEWGVRFDRDRSGRIALGLEAAHSTRRVLHAGDATGREIARALWARVVSMPSVHIEDHALVTTLLVSDGVVKGARYVERDGRVCDLRARTTLLATGGAGRVFRETTNPEVATGDGVALGYHAGASVADLEFVQFHPTALNKPGAPRFLLSEALRGEGARLVNASGERFMSRYHPDGDLAPRDVAARAIVREADLTGGGIYLTLAHLDRAAVEARFPTIAAMCRQAGLDLASDLVPVGPAAHYLMGGVETDEWGRTSMPGLFAAGETACTGVHGANRLASNSLLEGLVFGARAAIAMQEAPAAVQPLSNRRFAESARWLSGSPANQGGPVSVPDIMWRSAGLLRTRETLETATRLLQHEVQAAGEATSKSPEGLTVWRRFNLATVGWLIARAALRREESRGGHYRADFPARDDLHWKVHLVDKVSPHGQEAG
jgi:L-aspartate oxidase